MAEHEKQFASGPKKVLIVDDHPIVREGLAMLINHEKDLTVCGMAGRASEALRAVDALQPDLVVMDVSIQGTNGLEVTKAIRCRNPTLPVLILSMHEEDIYAERALRAGANGYLTKQEAPETVLKAVRTILAGGIHMSEAVSRRMVSEWAGRGKTGRTGVESLTDRELEVFEAIGHGLGTLEIAGRLNVSGKTVEAHRHNIRGKLRLRNAVDLTHYASCWIEAEARGPRTVRRRRRC
jgi:DNA-binding NarL/FixJ family response regulator